MASLNLVSYKILKTRIRNLGHTSTKNFKSILGSDELDCRCGQKLRFHRSRRVVQNRYAEELQVFFIHLRPKHMAEESFHRVDGSVRITEVLTLCFSSSGSCLRHFRWLSKFLPLLSNKQHGGLNYNSYSNPRGKLTPILLVPVSLPNEMLGRK